MKDYQPSIFDESERLEAISKLNDPLETLGEHIDFEIFRGQLEEILGKEEVKGPGGRPRLDAVMMFKALVLQRLYNLSDPQLEFQITDRLSFSRFLGLRLGGKIPDFTTVWRFREALGEGEGERKLFELFNARLDAQGVFAREGSIIDATIVEVPRQRNSRKENELIKNGKEPSAWRDQPRKLSQKDVDARWTKKNQINFYGYKDHIKTDTGTVLITDYRVTPANVHDSGPGRELVGPADKDKSLHADSAYKSAEFDLRLEELGVINQIHEKGTRATKLSEEQKAHNRQKSRIRALVEHVFGFMENSMNEIYLRCIGLKRVTCCIGLANLTYNLCRYSQLVRLGRVPSSMKAPTRPANPHFIGLPRQILRLTFPLSF